jgi:hypothetical protein
MTWKKPKPESVKEFKVPAVIWKADERDEKSQDKSPIFVHYTTTKKGDYKFQAASWKKKTQAEEGKTATTHECIFFLDENGNARIERLQGANINLNAIASQVPARSDFRHLPAAHFDPNPGCL